MTNNRTPDAPVRRVLRMGRGVKLENLLRIGSQQGSQTIARGDKLEVVGEA